MFGSRTRRGVAALVSVLLVASAIALPVMASGTVGAQGHNGNGPSEDGGPPATTGSSTATGPPATTGPPGDSDGNLTAPDSGLQIPGYIANGSGIDLGSLSPVEQRLRAISRLENVAPADERAARALGSAVDTINDSISAHVDRHRVTAPGPFSDDRAVLQTLRRVDSPASDNASVALVRADRGLAAQRIEDAETVLDRYGEDVASSGQRTKADRHLENAKRALHRGENATSSNGRASQRQRQAIQQYRQAWRHAETAIDTVNEAVGLSLSVEAEQHEPHDDAITYPIRGTLEAPDATVENVTIAVDGQHHETVELETSTAPGIPASFETDLRLPTTSATVTVEATDESTGQTVAETLDLRAPGFADEVYDVQLTDPESGAVVTVTGEGIVASDFQVDHVPAEVNRSFQAGSFIHIRNFTNFDDATVEMPLADDVDPSEGNLSLYKWDQHDGEPWHAIDTRVDAENGTLTAEVESFSYFSMFWVDNWNDAISVTKPLADRHIEDDDQGTVAPIDLAFVVDVSGSMSGDRIRHARDASQRFVGGLLDEDRAGLVSFASGATLEEPLTADHEAVNTSIAGLRTGGSTNTGAGLQTAIDELTANGQAEQQSIILLADGGTNTGPNPVEVARQADDAGITVNTIGVGPGIDAGELTDIADATGGDFYHVRNSSELPEVFDRIQQNRVSLVDSDEDGLPDAIEEMALGMPVGGPDLLGVDLGLDPDQEDSAGDGRLDSDVVDIEWVTFEENGEPTITARVTDSVFHPGSGESVTEEVVKMGVLVPAAIDPDTKDDRFELFSTDATNRYADGHVLMEGPDHVPAEGSCGFFCSLFGGSAHPGWLPDDYEDEDQLHIRIENVEIYLQYSHDVRTEDLPTEYELTFAGGNSDINIYDNTGTISPGETVTQTDIVVAGPDRDVDSNLPTQWETVGRLEADFEIDRDSPLYFESQDDGGTITLESAQPYFYERGSTRDYQDTYDEAMQVLKDGLISAAGGGPLSTPASAARVLIVSESMTTAGAVIAFNRGQSELQNVVDGNSDSEYDMYNSVIYEHTEHQGTVYGAGEIVDVDAAGTGPVMLRVNEPDVEDDQ